MPLQLKWHLFLKLNIILNVIKNGKATRISNLKLVLLFN